MLRRHVYVMPYTYAEPCHADAIILMPPCRLSPCAYCRCRRYCFADAIDFRHYAAADAITPLLRCHAYAATLLMPLRHFDEIF